MVRTIVLLFSVLPFIQPREAVKKITMTHLFPDFTEIYYVLKSDETTKQGNYRIEMNKRTIVLGHYNMGKKDSIWSVYDPKGVLRSRGWFESDKRKRIWEFFNNEGKLEQKIDFSKNEVLYYQSPIANNVFRVISGSDTLFTLLDRPPLFVGGTSRLNEYIADEITMPLHKLTDKTDGMVYVGFLIDSLGNTSNYHVLNGISAVCNQEALRVMQITPNEWIPGIYQGKKVTVEYIVPILFRNKPESNGPPNK